jgi:beta-N-acetylhexosaminidase
VVSRSARPRAAILGCAGTRLGAAERGFFAETDPLGIILFARNCESPAQVRALVDEIRATFGRAHAPVLIDQEGGRVARLRPPRWRAAPAAARLGALAAKNPDRATRAVWLNARLIAAELADLGITVDCAPVLDLALPETHEVIGDRAFGSDPELVATLGRSFCDGLLAGGVLPVVKHIPGHGRARADSHLELPAVDAAHETLSATDFAPFKALADQPWAMTAHIRYTALDPAKPCTISRRIISDIVRGEIGFSGVLVSDDLGMKALEGTFSTRAEAALEAGCDVVLHCSGVLDEMRELMAATPPLDDQAAFRTARAEASRRDASPFDGITALAELDALLQAS